MPNIPTVTVQAASAIGATGATLNGTITVADSGGNATVRGFNYGLTTGYGKVASATGSFAAGVFSQALTGLAAGKTYHYQSFATGPTGNGVSADATFTTPYKTPNQSGTDLIEVRMPGSDLYEVRV